MSGLPTVPDIQRILRIYGYVATTEYATRARAYIELLRRWNRAVALTTVSEPEEVVRFHFGESLFGIEQAKVQNGRLADLGSGAGFPGGPIAMARPELTVTLIESNGKKATFLEEVKRELNLTNVVVHRGRAEQITPDSEFEFVTARALGDPEKWLKWSAKRLRLGGRVILWLSSGGADRVHRYAGWKWSEQVKIPETKDRFVAIGEKEA